MEQQMSKVALSAVQLAKKQPPGSKGTAVEIKTNVVRIGLKPNIPFYKYDQRVYVVFKTNDGEEKLKELTKQTRDDYTEQDRKNATVRIYKKLLEQEKKFFGDGHSLFYDRAACLYTLKQLDVNGEKKIELPANYISGFEDAVGFRVVIKKAADSFQSNTNEILKTAKALPGEEDRTLLEVLNIIVGQAPLMNTGDFITYGNGTHYLYQPDMKVFRREDIPALRDGKYIGVGCNKAVKILEGPNGTPVPMTVIDVKKTAFHIDNQNLYDKITQLSIFRGSPTDNDINARKKSIIDQIKRLVVMTIYGKKKQVFPISGIAPIGAGGCMIEHAGKKMSIAQYFQSKYSIHLKHPSVFMVIGRIGQRDNMYPIELLEVAPNQRVTGSQQTPEQISKMGIADPIDRSRQTEAMRKSVQLNNTNPYIKQAGISVEDNFTTVQARLLPSPLLRVGDNKMITVERNYVWRNNGKFYDSKTLAKWTVYAQLVGRDADSAGMVSEYVKRLVSMGLSKGMKIAQPVRIDIEKNPNDCAVKQYMSQSRANGMQLVFIITSDQITLHNFIKKEEALQDMLTQEIKFSKLASTVQKNQAQTLENVIMKTNAKLGGLSKLILSGTDQKTQMWLNDPARLFFGFEFSHPAPLTPWEKERGEKHGKPSVVGYAANVQKNHQYYLGGYDYLPAHVPEALEDKLQEIFEENIRLCRSNRNVVPNHLVVYFNGISEGQFILVAGNYLKKIRAACSKICEQYKPKMTLIAAMKGHNERFYKKVVQGKNASEQNIPPGIVIDRHVISPTITEFFLNPHNAFKGTAKTPKYSVLYDDSSMPQDVIQGMTHGLCFGHDIVNSTISVPVPLIVADRYAKRGANNFTEYNNCEASGEINIEKAAQDISYNKNILKNVRYNA